MQPTQTVLEMKQQTPLIVLSWELEAKEDLVRQCQKCWSFSKL